MFNEAGDVSIGGKATLSVVHRDQYNQIINAQVVHMGTEMVKPESEHDNDPEYDQYREIKRGDINKFEQLDLEHYEVTEWKDDKRIRKSYRRTIHKAHVYGDDSVFTAISYHGRDAKKIWEDEFMKCSKADDPAVLLQLFAINRSNVPTLLFHDEWLPLGYLQMEVAVGFWEAYYLRVYTGAWWDKREPHCIITGRLWLNSRTGRVSPGPDGPYAIAESTSVRYNCENMPSVMEMATADTCVRFFNQTGAGNLDRHVLRYAFDMSYSMCIESCLGIGSPDCQNHGFYEGFWFCPSGDRIPCDEDQDLIGKLQLNTVYSGAQLDKIAILKEGFPFTWEYWSDALSDQTLIDSGLTRFRFSARGCSPLSAGFVSNSTRVLGDAWLSQFSRLDLPTSDLKTCFIPYLTVMLRLGLRPRAEPFGASDLETLPIVYLFLRPPPLYVADIDSWSSHISFWSFDESGTSEIPEEECKRLGLPCVSLRGVGFHLRFWLDDVYDGLHAWQVARGFDSSTADWALSLGLPILEPVITRFEEGVEEEPSTCNILPEPNANSISDDPFASNQLSSLSTPPATRIPKRQAPKKRKRVPVVIIHDTDSESEPESHAEVEACQSRVKSSGTSRIQESVSFPC